MPQVAGSLPAQSGVAPAAPAPTSGPTAPAPAVGSDPSPRRPVPEVNVWLAAGLGVLITGALLYISWLVAGSTFLVGLLGGMEHTDTRWLLLASPMVLGAGFAALPVGPFVATIMGGARAGFASIVASAVLIALTPLGLAHYSLASDLIGQLLKFSVVAALVFAAAALPGVMLASRLRGRAPRREMPKADASGALEVAVPHQRAFRRGTPRPSVPAAERRAVYCDACGASNVPGRARCLMCDAWLHERT